MNVQLYQAATTIAALEESGVPALIHRRATDAVRDHIAGWAIEKGSRGAHMVYRHWADTVRTIVYGPGSSADEARVGDPEDFRAYVYLKSEIAKWLPDWVREARQIDDQKGYKLARKIGMQRLSERLAYFRVGRELFEEEMLGALNGQ